MIDGISLESADRHSVIDHVAAATRFTGMLAYHRTGSRERVVLADQPYCVGITPFGDQRNVSGNIHPGGAERHTGNRLVQAAEAAVPQNMLLIVIPEALKPLENHRGRLTSDGAVGGIHNHPRRLFQEAKGVETGLSIKHLLEQTGQLPKSDAAGNTLSTGLRMTEVQKREGQVNRTESRRTCGDAALYIAVESFHDHLGAVGGNDLQSTHTGNLLVLI